MLKGIQDRLYKYKVDNDISYEDLGKLIGTTESVAFDICRHRRKFFPLDVLDKMLKLLGENKVQEV